jgi:membrane protein YqaA with SNARE-associated domain
MAIYLDIFLESLGAKFMLPVSSEATLAAMNSFGGYNMISASAVAVGGAMAAQVLNFLTGRLLLVLKNREQIFVSEVIYERCARLGRGFALPLLLLAWVDFGSLLTVAAGFFNVPATRAFPVLLVSMIGFYAYQLMQ